MFLRGNAGIDLWRVSHTSGSKSVPSRSGFKRSGGACLSPTYTGDWLFIKSHHLVKLSNSIKPWPMTLAPTNETIRCEIMQKKRPRGEKKVPLWFGNIKVRCKDSIYQISVRLMRAGDNLIFLIYLSTKGVTLRILSLSDCVPRWILIVQFVWTVVIVHGSLLYGLSALRRIPSCVNRTLSPTF